jgi:hypothetical protein
MGDRDDEKERQDEDLRLASGWGRRAPKPPEREWPGSPRSDEAETEDEDAGREHPAEDVDIAGDAGAISGRAEGRTPAPPDDQDPTRN